MPRLLPRAAGVVTLWGTLPDALGSAGAVRASLVRAFLVFAGLASAGLVPDALSGQVLHAARGGPASGLALETTALEWPWETRAPFLAPQNPPVGVARATASSALLPGLGQHFLGQKRKWAYLGLEVVGWFFFADRRSAGSDLRDRYRDFAWQTARLQQGSRVDGDFDYYETLTNWTRSGAFDADLATTGLQPEMDPTTFNGSVWSLANRLFLSGLPPVPETDPQYQRALDYYRDRAYGAEFLWDWTGTGSGQDEFTDLISESDDRFRQATNVLGAVIANHVVSAVDAYLSARGLAHGLEARVVPVRTEAGVSWRGLVRVPLPDVRSP